METVLIVIHLMVVLALVGVVLLQRSEGGGLGIGGGSGFMTARGAANALTRATAILAAAFFVTSLTLSIVARYSEKPIDILDRVPARSAAMACSTSCPAPRRRRRLRATPHRPPCGQRCRHDASGNGSRHYAPATAPAPATPPATDSAAPPATNGVTLPVTPQVPNQ